MTKLQKKSFFCIDFSKYRLKYNKSWNSLSMIFNSCMQLTCSSARMLICDNLCLLLLKLSAVQQVLALSFSCFLSMHFCLLLSSSNFITVVLIGIFGCLWSNLVYWDTKLTQGFNMCNLLLPLVGFHSFPTILPSIRLPCPAMLPRPVWHSI